MHAFVACRTAVAVSAAGVVAVAAGGTASVPGTGVDADDVVGVVVLVAIGSISVAAFAVAEDTPVVDVAAVERSGVDSRKRFLLLLSLATAAAWATSSYGAAPLQLQRPLNCVDAVVAGESLGRLWSFRPRAMQTPAWPASEHVPIIFPRVSERESESELTEVVMPNRYQNQFSPFPTLSQRAPKKFMQKRKTGQWTGRGR